MSLGEQRLARLVGSEPADLQRNEAVVPAVDRLHHLGVPALPEHLEQLVTIGDDASTQELYGQALVVHMRALDFTAARL